MWREHFSSGFVQPPTRKVTWFTQKSICWKKEDHLNIFEPTSTIVFHVNFQGCRSKFFVVGHLVFFFNCFLIKKWQIQKNPGLKISILLDQAATGNSMSAYVPIIFEFPHWSTGSRTCCIFVWPVFLAWWAFTNAIELVSIAHLSIYYIDYKLAQMRCKMNKVWTHDAHLMSLQAGDINPKWKGVPILSGIHRLAWLHSWKIIYTHIWTSLVVLFKVMKNPCPKERKRYHYFITHGGFAMKTSHEGCQPWHFKDVLHLGLWWVLVFQAPKRVRKQTVSQNLGWKAENHHVQKCRLGRDMLHSFQEDMFYVIWRILAWCLNNPLIWPYSFWVGEVGVGDVPLGFHDSSFGCTIVTLP